jgi:signal transduction histidine kinase
MDAGLMLSAGWVLLSLVYAPGITLLASFIAFAGFAAARLIYGPRRRVLATTLWMTGTNLAIFLGSFGIPAESQLIYMLVVMTGLPFVYFAWSSSMVPAMAMALLPPFLWLVRFLVGDRFDDFHMVTPEIASQIFAPIVTVTIFAAVVFQVAYFAVLMRRHERDLEAANLAAEQASRAKTAFLSGISHEMRTPLNGVIGLAGLIGDRARAEGDRTLIEYADGIHTSGHELLAIVNKTVEFADLSTRRGQVACRPVQLGPLIADLLGRYRDRAAAAGMSMRVEHAGQASAMADRRLLDDALVQVLDNALRYAGAGARVTLSVAPVSNGQVQITVADTGPGFVAADPELPFAPFERLGNATSSTFGAGMGLPIARIKITAMGGRIDIGTGPKRGAVVRITLPAAASVAEGAAPVTTPLPAQ